MRQISKALCDKLLRDMGLLKQCSEAENVRETDRMFCASIEPFRRTNRVGAQLFWFCEQVSQPLTKRCFK